VLALQTGVRGVTIICEEPSLLGWRLFMAVCPTLWEDGHRADARFRYENGVLH
jgi:hypothetical protein